MVVSVPDNSTRPSQFELHVLKVLICFTDKHIRKVNICCTFPFHCKVQMMANLYSDTQQQNFTRPSPDAVKVEDPMYSAILTANIVFSAFLCYSTTMMNIVTIHALRKTTLLSKPLKTLLLSLAVSDLGVGFLGYPFQITYLIELNRPDTNTASDVVVSVLFLSSLCSIVAISADRYIAIQMPLRYEQIVTRKRTFAVVALIWLFSAVFPCLCYGFQVISPYSAFVVLVIIEFISFAGTTLSSCKIYLTVRLHKGQMMTQLQQVLQNGDMVNRLPRYGSEKSSHGTLLIYLLFWVCYLPHLVISIVREVHASQNNVIKGMFVCAGTLVFFNSSINPVIYCWKMRPIRRTIINILRDTLRTYLLGNRGVMV